MQIGSISHKAFVFLRLFNTTQGHQELFAKDTDKKLSCRREVSQCFVTMNISQNHSRSLKVVRNGTIR